VQRRKNDVQVILKDRLDDEEYEIHLILLLFEVAYNSGMRQM